MHHPVWWCRCVPDDVQTILPSGCCFPANRFRAEVFWEMVRTLWPGWTDVSRAALLPGDRVVDIAELGGCRIPGKAACRVAGADEVGQFLRRAVAGLGAQQR